MKKALWIILAAPLLGSCNDAGGVSVNPTSGTWSFVAGEIFDDTCHYPDPPVDPNGFFALTNNGDGTFTVDTNAEETFLCALSGRDFDCPQRRMVTIDATGLAAVFHIHAVAEGSFSADTATAGFETATVTCDGADCAAAAATAGLTAALPCHYSERFTANLPTR